MTFTWQKETQRFVSQGYLNLTVFNNIVFPFFFACSILENRLLYQPLLLCAKRIKPKGLVPAMSP